METFTVTGHSLLDPGYTSLLTWQALSNNESLPKLVQGDKVNIQEVIIFQNLFSSFLFLSFVLFIFQCSFFLL